MSHLFLSFWLCSAMVSIQNLNPPHLSKNPRPKLKSTASRTQFPIQTLNVNAKVNQITIKILNLFIKKRIFIQRLNLYS